MAAWGERGHLAKPNHSQSSNSALNQLLDEVSFRWVCWEISASAGRGQSGWLQLPKWERSFRIKVFTNVTCDSL